MIVIVKGQNNPLTLTLNEKSTLDNPTYLFRFKNDVTGEIVRFITANTSEYTDRYDRFLITETDGSLNLTSGVINLSPSGFWSYTIYEQTSTSNLDENLSTGIVETGKVKVIGDERTTAVFDNNPKTYVAFGS